MENVRVPLRQTTFIATLITFILIAFGCNKESDCCFIIDTDVQILYKDNNGNNLINSVDQYNENKIRVYYKKGDEYEYVYKGDLDAPNMHKLYVDQDSNLVLTVYPSNNYEGNFSTTLIELNPNVVDTLLCEFDLSTNREVCINAWLNGIEMPNRILEVEK